MSYTNGKDTHAQLDNALILSKIFKIFPLIPNSKLPAIKDFTNQATTDSEQIKSWWKKWPEANIGISTNELVVIDIDMKGNRNGYEELSRIEKEHGVLFEPTFSQKTPSGGRHLIYKLPPQHPPVRQGTNLLGPGLDIRAKGGYIVGPGSLLNGVAYEGEFRELAFSNEWLLKKCDRSYSFPKNDANPRGVEINREYAQRRAENYLKFEAPQASEGERNSVLFKVGAQIKDFGCSFEQCFGLVLELWLEHCNPPLETDEIERTLRSVYKSSQNEIGHNAPEMVFDPIESENDPVDKKKGKLFGELFKDTNPDFNQPYLVEKLLAPKAMSVVYGESGSGKTFFCLDLALHIALGRTWLDKKVEQGLVFYVAAEGGWGIKKRIKAFRQYHNLNETDVPFVLIPCSIDLLNARSHLKELSQLIKNFEELLNQKTNCIIIDTLARAISGGNENSPEDMGSFVRNVDELRYQTDSHVMVIHHSGKDVARGMRGHSSLRAATDTEIEISDNTAKVKKQRDQDFCTPFEFKLHQIEIGKNKEGAPITSCVVLGDNRSVERDFSKKPLEAGSLAEKAYKTLKIALEWEGIAPPDNLDLPEDKTIVPVTVWREMFTNEHCQEMSRQHKSAAFLRSVERLLKEGLIEHQNNLYFWTV